MEKLKLGLDLDNYPELIGLKIIEQEMIEDNGHRAITGTAKVLMDKDTFESLLEVYGDARLINLKTGRVLSDYVIYEIQTEELKFLIPKRQYCRKRKRE